MSETPTKIPIELWPVAVLQDRYSGIYSDGEWIAIAICDAARWNEVLDGAHGDDGDAQEFWWIDPDRAWVATGRTPDLAIRALLNKQPAP